MPYIYSMEDLGALVKTERKAQHLTQTDLADVSDVGLSFIVNLEHGKPTTEAGKAINVLQALGIDLIAQKRGEDFEPENIPNFNR